MMVLVTSVAGTVELSGDAGVRLAWWLLAKHRGTAPCGSLSACVVSPWQSHAFDPVWAVRA